MSFCSIPSVLTFPGINGKIEISDRSRKETKMDYLLLKSLDSWHLWLDYWIVFFTPVLYLLYELLLNTLTFLIWIKITIFVIGKRNIFNKIKNIYKSHFFNYVFINAKCFLIILYRHLKNALLFIINIVINTCNLKNPKHSLLYSIVYNHWCLAAKSLIHAFTIILIFRIIYISESNNYRLFKENLFCKSLKKCKKFILK